MISLLLSLTVKVAGVILRLQLGDELCLLPQQAVPVQTVKELMVLDLIRPSCLKIHIQSNFRNNVIKQQAVNSIYSTLCIKYLFFFGVFFVVRVSSCGFVAFHNIFTLCDAKNVMLESS